MTGFGSAESDRILVPTSSGYEEYTLRRLARRFLASTSGFGLAPLHFITQRGPFQDGESPLGMRYDRRIIQITMQGVYCNRNDLFDARNEMLDLLRPNRSFDGTVCTLAYRKRLPSGSLRRGVDMTVTNGITVVTSNSARFVARGTGPGTSLVIAGVRYQINYVSNDYTAVLTQVYAGLTAANVAWEFRDGFGIRDLCCLLEFGPTFDETRMGTRGLYQPRFLEVLRFVAHDPFWYGESQNETWAFESFGDLVFDGAGAWFGGARGVGRWLFSPDSIGEAVNVVYWGTKEAKPIITIVGPALNPSVYNQTIGDKIEMDYYIGADETVTINTLALTVTNNLGENLLPYTAGDLATFGLFPEPQAPNRINQVLVSFGSGEPDVSQATMTWRNRYVGI